MPQRNQNPVDQTLLKQLRLGQHFQIYMKKQKKQFFLNCLIIFHNNDSFFPTQFYFLPKMKFFLLHGTFMSENLSSSVSRGWFFQLEGLIFLYTDVWKMTG